MVVLLYVLLVLMSRSRFLSHPSYTKYSSFLSSQASLLSQAGNIYLSIVSYICILMTSFPFDLRNILVIRHLIRPRLLNGLHDLCEINRVRHVIEMES